MSNNEKVKQLFRQVVQEYSCGDVRALLDAELGKAAPLLASVVNGIDFIGGMMLGFDVGSRKRSVEFMVQYFGLHKEVATLVYTLVRCGVAHEGTPKLAIKFFVYPERVEHKHFLYTGTDNVVWLNVTDFAHLYLEAIDKIASDVLKHLKHIPNAKASDEAAFTNGLPHITSGITEFCRAVARLREVPERERLNRGEIECLSSSSPFLAERLCHFTVPKT